MKNIIALIISVIFALPARCPMCKTKLIKAFSLWYRVRTAVSYYRMTKNPHRGFYCSQECAFPETDNTGGGK